MWISRYHRNVIIDAVKKVDFFPHKKERIEISMSEHEICENVPMVLGHRFGL